MKGILQTPVFLQPGVHPHLWLKEILHEVRASQDRPAVPVPKLDFILDGLLRLEAGDYDRAAVSVDVEVLFQRGQSGGAGVDDLFGAGGFGEGEDVSCLVEFVGGVGGVHGEVEEEGGAGLEGGGEGGEVVT